MTESGIQRSSLYDGTSMPGIALMHRIIQALAQEHLVRDSPYAGGEIRGLVSNNHVGALGYCIHDYGATWLIDVVLSGKRCGVHYRVQKEWGGEHGEWGELHYPIDADQLYKPIARAFMTLGFSVQAVAMVGYQSHWDDDITYQVSVQAPTEGKAF